MVATNGVPGIDVPRGAVNEGLGGKYALMMDPRLEKRRDDWDQHWDEYAGAAELNPAQQYRRRLILRTMSARAPLVGAHVLDIGSGQGDFAVQVAPLLGEGQFVGVDVAESGVRMSRRKTPQFTFFVHDFARAGALPPEYRGWATHAVCSEVLEHSDAPQQILEEIAPYLRDDASLFVTVPGGPMSAFDRHIGHRRHYGADSLRELLQQSGYDVLDVVRAGFPFFNLYRLAVILAGARLIRDLSSTESSGRPSLLARAAMRTFGLLFRLNVIDSSLGWQLMAVARKRPGRAEPGRAGDSSGGGFTAALSDRAGADTLPGSPARLHS